MQIEVHRETTTLNWVVHATFPRLRVASSSGSNCLVFPQLLAGPRTGAGWRQRCRGPLRHALHCARTDSGFLHAPCVRTVVANQVAAPCSHGTTPKTHPIRVDQSTMEQLRDPALRRPQANVCMMYVPNMAAGSPCCCFVRCLSCEWRSTWSEWSSCRD